jgi:hypothetical protein
VRLERVVEPLDDRVDRIDVAFERVLVIPGPACNVRDAERRRVETDVTGHDERGRLDELLVPVAAVGWRRDPSTILLARACWPSAVSLPGRQRAETFDWR